MKASTTQDSQEEEIASLKVSLKSLSDRLMSAEMILSEQFEVDQALLCMYLLAEYV